MAKKAKITRHPEDIFDTDLHHVPGLGFVDKNWIAAVHSAGPTNCMIVWRSGLATHVDRPIGALMAALYGLRKQ